MYGVGVGAAPYGATRMDRDQDIAIIGMACLFPGAADPASYWTNIVNGICAITDHPDPDATRILDPESPDFERVYTLRGGYLRELASFDPLAFGVMPKAVEGSDPNHLLALKAGYAALEDAGLLAVDFPRERTDVILGYCVHLHAANANWMQHGIVLDQTLDLVKRLAPGLGEGERAAIRAALRASLPPMDSQAVPSVSGNVLASRIANRLDLMGSCYTVDAACASSIISVEQAATNLMLGRCDVALAGGVYGFLGTPMLMLFSELGALSRSPVLRPFGREADGTILGEGVGMLVLKRRADAQRDGNPCYAIIKGFGVASDGRESGLLAPRKRGEALAVRRAYRNAGVDPDTVGLVEAHGTGIPLGDRTEIEALREVFGDRRGAEADCALGSVKSMIGHTISAAGVAGVIKAALALHQQVLPPTLFGECPHPDLGLDESRFYLCPEARPWIHPRGSSPRRAGVSAMGFGGINIHCVLEEAV